MRWSEEKIHVGDLRKRSGFLIVPKQLWNLLLEVFETRWLEYTTWMQRFVGYGDFGSEYWNDSMWFEKEEGVIKNEIHTNSKNCI